MRRLRLQPIGLALGAMFAIGFNASESARAQGTDPRCENMAGHCENNVIEEQLL